ncbi:MAG TPA: prepilin-type N-terminal cleavage/methylation domain-containing protein [Phycisphaerae bacterium]|nr:prepilin-type N-terminal cleavage/methylation domain-containing protein [Phycisphaerae bacterium]
MINDSPPQRRRPPTHGFTLVEVLIVVIVIGIAAMVTLPMLSEAHTTRLKTAARLLVADLGFARVESLARPDDPCVVVFDRPNNAYTIARASHPTTPITNPADGKPYVTQYGIGRALELAGVTIQGYSLDGNDQLGFSADARLTFGADGPLGFSADDRLGFGADRRLAFGANDRLGFGAKGRLDQPSAAEITLQSGTLTLTITVDPTTGRPSVGTFSSAPPPNSPPTGAPRQTFRPRFQTRFACIPPTAPPPAT